MPSHQPLSPMMIKKNLYSLVRSPLHWYNNISQFFLSIGLRISPNSPCVFVGNILDNEPPLYLGLYVDDFCYFSASNKVETEFKNKLNKNYSVSYDNKLEWFLGMKFEWKLTGTDLQYLVHQEAFVLDMVDRCGLNNCNRSPRATNQNLPASYGRLELVEYFN